MDNVLFSSLTMNVQPLHLDAHFAAQTEFGKPLVNSLFTLGLLIGMTVNDTTLGTTIANLGMTDVAFPCRSTPAIRYMCAPASCRRATANHGPMRASSNSSTQR